METLIHVLSGDYPYGAIPNQLFWFSVGIGTVVLTAIAIKIGLDIKD